MIFATKTIPLEPKFAGPLGSPQKQILATSLSIVIMRENAILDF